MLAHRALNKVVAQIRDDQWDMEVPPDFARRQTERTPTLREVVSYLAYDDSWVADMLAGRTMAEVGSESFRGDLLGAEPKAAFAAVVDRACAAAEQLDDLDRTVHCSFGDFPAREYLVQVSSFRAFRAVDIARMIGVDDTLSEPLVEGVWAEISPVVEQLRAIGVFPAAISVPEAAPLQERLLGLVGRRPRAS